MGVGVEPACARDSAPRLSETEPDEKDKYDYHEVREQRCGPELCGHQPRQSENAAADNKVDRHKTKAHHSNYARE
jgi:hypothetical protein